MAIQSVLMFLYRALGAFLHCKVIPLSALRFLATVLFVCQIGNAREVLIERGSTWSYYASSALPAKNWGASDFDDSSWKNAAGPIGIDHPMMNTVIETEAAVAPTCFFRRTVRFDEEMTSKQLRINILANDSYMIFLDGRLMFASGIQTRNYASPGRIGHHPGDYYQYVRGTTYGDPIPKGLHTMAVVVFQHSQDTGRMVFDLELIKGAQESVTEEIIPKEALWKFLDTRNPPSANWAAMEFDDSAWKAGQALLGYGDSDVVTTLDFGKDDDNKPLTAWFRKEFTLDDATRTPDEALIQFLRDDGAIVYLNGVEVARNNMPDDDVDHNTPAEEGQNGAYERMFREYNIDGRFFRPGRNVVAAEIHQKKSDSSDLAFDLTMKVDFVPREWRWTKNTAKPSPTKSRSNQLDLKDMSSLAKAGSAQWRTLSVSMLDSALESYEDGSVEESSFHYNVSLWAKEFGKAASRLPLDLKRYLISSDASGLSSEYFDLLSSSDNSSKIYSIIKAIHEDSPVAFMKFPKLAFAIAIVYDQTPARYWPHSQVSRKLLPRTLPDPVAAFKFWSSADEKRKTLYRLESLQLDELKYVVDVPVSIEALEKALKVKARLTGMKKLYSGIVYDTPRYLSGVYNWPHDSYDLDTIKERGGICVDQAYYTTIVAKAHGVPAMLVSGAGQQGYHAWVGFLDKREWNFETGRYPESKFVTGDMYDPQTWKKLTDHEVAFLSERFRGFPSYKSSRVHVLVAKAYLSRNEMSRAEKAAKAAIAAEKRNYEAWDLMLKCLSKRKATAAEEIAVLTKAATAFNRYADLESDYVERLAGKLIAQGDTGEANRLRARILSRNREERPDLALVQAQREFGVLIKEKSVRDQVSYYKRTIRRFDEAGLIVFNAMTKPFLSHLYSKNEKKTALDVLDYTRRKLKGAQEGQLQQALAKWESRLEK